MCEVAVMITPNCELTLPVARSSGFCWLTGGPGSGVLFSMPRSPREKTAANAKYGFMSAPGTRTSSRLALGGTDGGLRIRTEAARES
jgi:hypothetical protein